MSSRCRWGRRPRPGSSQSRVRWAGSPLNLPRSESTAGGRAISSGRFRKQCVLLTSLRPRGAGQSCAALLPDGFPCRAGWLHLWAGHFSASNNARCRVWLCAAGRTCRTARFLQVHLEWGEPAYGALAIHSVPISTRHILWSARLAGCHDRGTSPRWI